MINQFFNTDVSVALITAFSAIMVPIIGFVLQRYQKKTKRAKLELEQAENVIGLKREALNFGEFLTHWGEIVEQVNILFEETRLERFILFQCFNGANEPRWVTAIIQLRKDGKPLSYMHLPIDADYLGRFLQMKSSGFTRVTPNRIGPCMIRDIYVDEGVEDSLWAFIKTRQLDEFHASTTFCSFATNHSGGLDPSTVIRCKNLVGRLQLIASHFPGATLA